MRVLNNAFGNQMPSEEVAATCLAGGIMQHGYQCGMIWGSALAAGRQAFHLFGLGPQAEAAAILASQKVVERFQSRNKHVNCIDLTGIDKSSTPWQMTVHFLFKGGTVDCMRMATGYAPEACMDIETTLEDKGIEAPPGFAGCTSILARRLGASDLHSTMAAGLAGGIGLSGGGCGALGTAIWLFNANKLSTGHKKIDYRDPRAGAITSRFVKASGAEFECARIAGRRFSDLADHANYLRQGGCANIIEALTQNA